MMRAIQVHKAGGPTVLQLASNVAVPKATGTKVLINVKAAGINPVDTYIREGAFGYTPPLPYTPGKDGAGIVEAVGEAVHNFKKGDRVFFSNRCRENTHGSYAQYCLVDTGDTWPLPERLTFQQGAALGIPYLTAYRALVLKAGAQEGETVLVHGASGSVGIATLQIAKSLVHAKVIGTAGTSEGIELVKKLGADCAVCHKDKDYLKKIMEWTENKGVNVVVEMLANVNLAKDLGLLCREGRVVVIGSRGTITINPRDLMGLETTITGVSLFSSTPRQWAQSAAAIVDGARAGWVDPVVNKVYPLGDAKQAHNDITHSKGAHGRLVLDPDA
uniref:Putative zinc-binding oxidoreductase n=1 Tax=Ornithodoros turicata TaxID=34597 RepID=A0A2R5LKW1_9ACAR